MASKKKVVKKPTTKKASKKVTTKKTATKKTSKKVATKKVTKKTATKKATKKVVKSVEPAGHVPPTPKVVVKPNKMDKFPMYVGMAAVVAAVVSHVMGLWAF